MNPCYKAWHESDGSDILWLIGKPGSGKSTLLRKLLREASHQTQLPSLQGSLSTFADDDEPSRQNEQGESRDRSCESDGERDDHVERKIVASYFYNFRDENEMDNGRMLQSILFQILSQDSRLFPSFRNTYLRLRKLGSQTSIQWSLDDCISIFQKIVDVSDCRIRIEIFLDAVDESKDSSRVMEILRQAVVRSTRSDIIIKAMVARRPLETMFDIPHNRRIQLEQHNATDIEKVINMGIEEIEKRLQFFIDKVVFVRHHQAQLNKLKNELATKANGVALWVSVALNTIKGNIQSGEYTVDSMMDLLDALPSDLEDLYTHMIHRLQEKKEGNIQSVKHKLHWTTYNGRPLSVKEFFHAIAVSEGLWSTNAELFNLENVVIPHDRLDGVALTLSNSCGGFLEAQAPQLRGQVFDSEKFLVQLIHRSVRIFLEKEEAGPFRVVQRECNLEITDTCIRYLRVSLPCHGRIQGSDTFVQHLGQHSLLAYIWTELPIHLHYLDQDVLAEKLQELTSLLRELRRIDGRHPGFLLMHTWTLRLVAPQPRDQVVFEQWKAETRSKLTEPTNIPSGLQTFLRDTVVAAIEANQFRALKTILDAGALSCDKDDSILCAGLVMATKMNNLAILESIGEHRKAIDPNDSSMLRETLSKALETACKEGYTEVSKWLLKRGAVTATADQGCTAIYLAVNSGHGSVVKTLLDHGINPHYQRHNSRSLLWIAAEKGHVQIIRDLLHFGADPYSADDQDRTPLVMALEANHDAIVRNLLPLTGENPVITNSKPTLPFLVPRKRNPNFVGMSDVLKWLEDALKSQVNHIALCGMAGTG